MKAYIEARNDEKISDVADSLRSAFKKVKIEEIHLSQKADLIFSVGGDGTLIHNILEHLDCGVPFVGVNAGSVGYLCYIKPESLEKDLSCLINDFKKEKAYALGTFEVALSNYGLDFKKTAVQDVRVERLSHRAIRMKILNNKRLLAKRYCGDGIVITGALGSTAYNNSAYGPIIDLEEDIIALTPACPFARGKSVYDSILRSYVFSEIDIEIVVEKEARVVLDSNEYEISDKHLIRVRIKRGKKNFRLFTRRQ